MKTAIIIPARYGSTRFPGKPLAQIAGKSMLQRVVEIGQQVAREHPQVTLLVATDDERIARHASEIHVDCIMTSPNCPTGSDRVLEAATISGASFDFLIGLQGDAPFTPPEALHKMIEAAKSDSSIQVITPVAPLRWAELDALRQAKTATPFSGTTTVVDRNGNAIWFSKNILPAIRNEDRSTEFSPVLQHIGLYGYRTGTLRRFVSMKQGHYEELEGLEQLRLIENGILIRTIRLTVGAGLAQAGIDSPEDIERAERVLAGNI